MQFDSGTLWIQNLFAEKNDESVSGFQSLSKFLSDSYSLSVIQYDVTNLSQIGSKKLKL